jgi:hypothetical protein
MHMKNAVDRLFDSVMDNLGAAKDLDWPDAPTDFSDIFDLHDPIDSDGDQIYTIDQENASKNLADRIVGGRSYDQLNQDTLESIEGGVRVRGFETLAFYKSKRFISVRPFAGRWGVFYLKQGLIYVESQIRDAYPGYSDPRKLALTFLRQHERFHYRADVQTLLFEATLGRHLYIPTHKALRGRRTCFVEEALANRQVWDWARKQAIGLEEFAHDFMLLQPNAYARFQEPRLELAAEWAGTMVDQKPPGMTFRNDLSHWVEATPSGLLRSSLCPEYVVYPEDLSRWFSPTLVVPPVTYVQDGENVVKALQGRFAHLHSKWKKTKAKLLENRLVHGLNFKPWPKDGPDRYSVRVDDNFRAHLQHLGNGKWLAYILGPHTKLGHG